MKYIETGGLQVSVLSGLYFSGLKLSRFCFSIYSPYWTIASYNPVEDNLGERNIVIGTEVNKDII